MGAFLMSLPSRERGLKSKGTCICSPDQESLPSRERGLKLPEGRLLKWDRRRSPRGSVD